MIIIVTGGRTFDSYETVAKVLDHIGPDLIVHGGCEGADELADRWCKSRGKTSVAVYPDWNAKGRAAGPLRNQEMLDDWVAECVVAFPGNSGTLDMITRAKGAGVAIHYAVDVLGDIHEEER